MDKTHILSESLPNRDDDDEMSQQLKDIFHPPVKAKQIDPAKIMKKEELAKSIVKVQPNIIKNF